MVAILAVHVSLAASDQKINRRSQPMSERDDHQPGCFSALVGFMIGAIDQHPNPEHRQREDNDREHHESTQNRREFYHDQNDKTPATRGYYKATPEL